MKRRTFIAALGSAVAWPHVAQAQGERVQRIGVLPLGLTIPETLLATADEVIQ
jgi:hypothetical protein